MGAMVGQLSKPSAATFQVDDMHKQDKGYLWVLEQDKMWMTG